MASVYCVKCGKTAYSKCPFCRNIFPKHASSDAESWTLEILEHHLVIKDDLVSFKIYPGETAELVLNHMVPQLAKLSPAGIKQLACLHEWDFTPFSKSDIDCGHRSEEKPVLDFMSDAWHYLVDANFQNVSMEFESEKYPHGDQYDLEAAEIIDRALDAVDHGIPFVYVRKQQ
jgi:hypothetical protein